MAKYQTQGSPSLSPHEVLPIPGGEDFRVTLSEEEQALVAREIDESVRQSLNRGTENR